MQAHCLRAFGIVPVLFALVCAAGCGEKTATVSGKLVLPASAKLVDTDSVTVSFLPVDASKKAPITTYTPGDKSFTSKEVQTGKYKISVTVTPYPGEKDSPRRTPLFENINKAYQGNATKLEYELTTDPLQQSITVDLDKGTVTKS
jgi:hypothetical protein